MVDVQTLITILNTKSTKSLLKQLHRHLEGPLFFKNIGCTAALALASKEATFAHHTATHWQSFRSSDCTVNFGYKRFRYKGFSLIRDYAKGPK